MEKISGSLLMAYVKFPKHSVSNDHSGGFVVRKVSPCKIVMSDYFAERFADFIGISKSLKKMFHRFYSNLLNLMNFRPGAKLEEIAMMMSLVCIS